MKTDLQLWFHKVGLIKGLEDLAQVLFTCSEEMEDISMYGSDEYKNAAMRVEDILKSLLEERRCTQYDGVRP